MVFQMQKKYYIWPSQITGNITMVFRHDGFGKDIMVENCLGKVKGHLCPYLSRGDKVEVSVNTILILWTRVYNVL